MLNYRFAAHDHDTPPKDLGGAMLADDIEAFAFGKGLIREIMHRDAEEYIGWTLDVTERERAVCSIVFELDAGQHEVPTTMLLTTPPWSKLVSVGACGRVQSVNWTAVFYLAILASIAGVLVGLTIGGMFATNLNAAVPLAALSVLISYGIGLGASVVLFGVREQDSGEAENCHSAKDAPCKDAYARRRVTVREAGCHANGAAGAS